MASYSHTTFAQAKAALKLRLGDTNGTFWSDTELGLYLIDALRTWNSMSWAFRDRGLLTTVSGQAFYDPRDTLLDGGGVKLLDRTLKDRDLVGEIQYHLLEPSNVWASSTTWAGTEMFMMADVQGAVQRRLNQFLLETGQIVTESKLSVGAGTDKLSLPDTVMDLRRVAWVEMDGASESTYTNLWRVDDFQLTALAIGINLTPGQPQVYSILTLPEAHLRLSPPTNAPGKVHLLTIDSGTALDVTSGVKLNVLDDFAHIIKWGALADLLSRDGPAKDPERAAYCQQRWDIGVQASLLLTTVLSAYVNDVAADIVSLFDLDTAQPNWQSTTGAPTGVALAGANQIALSPVPDEIYSFTLDVVRNAIVPAADGDYLQIGREYLDSLLDYAQHLAAFKMGGTEFKASIPLYQQFARAAIRFNERLRANAPMFDSLIGSMVREETQRPRVANDNAQALSA